jgi:DNA-binding NarL/FixJ family response regulator
VRVVIADDALIVRSGLGALLATAGEEVVGSAKDADELLAQVESRRPDAVVVDVRMPPTQTDEGIVAAGRIRRDYPGVGVLVLSQAAETSYAMRLLEENPSGVGYLLKERVADASVLVDSLRRVCAGECVVDPLVISRLLARARAGDPLGALTGREREVLSEMAEGRSNSGVAARLYLSEKTVETHVSRIFSKLGLVDVAPVDNRRVLAVLAFLREGNPR